MPLYSAASAVLKQLSQLVEQLRNNDLQKPSHTLHQATIGQHVRHSLEFFICLEEGYYNGTVSYDKRNRNRLIETDTFIALSTIHRIVDFVRQQPIDRGLRLGVSYDLSSDVCAFVETTFFRELIYTIEHAVHHMAIMKIGIQEVAPDISLPADFGVAVSTLRYHQNQLLAIS